MQSIQFSFVYTRSAPPMMKCHEWSSGARFRLLRAMGHAESIFWPETLPTVICTYIDLRCSSLGGGGWQAVVRRAMRRRPTWIGRIWSAPPPRCGVFWHNALELLGCSRRRHVGCSACFSFLLPSHTYTSSKDVNKYWPSFRTAVEHGGKVSVFIL